MSGHPDRLRDSDRRPRGRLALLIVCLVALLPAVAAADDVEVRAGVRDGIGRLVFDWPRPVRYTAEIFDGQLAISFSRTIRADLNAAQGLLTEFISAARISPDGRSALFELSGELSFRDFASGNSVVVDLAPPEVLAAAPVLGLPGQPAPQVARQKQPAAQAPPAPVREPSSGERPVPVRVGEHSDYSRLVFDWSQPVEYAVDKEGARVEVSFESTRPVELDALRRDLPPLLTSAEYRAADAESVVILGVDPQARIRHFRIGTKVVLDVMRSSRRSAAATDSKPADAPPAAEQTPSASAPEPAEPAPAPQAELEPDAEAELESAVAPIPPAEDQPAEAAASETEPDAAKLDVRAGAGVVTLRLALPKDARLAAFRRAGYAWVVIDQPSNLKLDGLSGAGDGIIGDAEQLPNRAATVLRMALRPGYNPAVLQEDGDWLIDFRGQPIVPQLPLNARAVEEPDGQAALRVLTRRPAQPISLIDPEVGDQLLVVPLAQPGEGTDDTRQYSELSILPSAQGLVIAPRADGLRVVSEEDTVMVSRPGGLFVTPRAANPDAAAALDGTLVLDFRAWMGDPDKDFVENKHALNQAISFASESQLNRARYDLARFLFANGFHHETLAMLELIETESQTLAQTPEFLLVHGATAFLAQRYDIAAKKLEAELLRGSAEAALWRAGMAAERGNATIAAQLFKRAGAAPPTYPERLRAKLGFAGARAALEAEAGDLADALIGELRDLRLSEEQRDDLTFLIGGLELLNGNRDQARELWREVRASPDPRVRAEAEYRLIGLGLNLGELEVGDAIERLEALRFAWRGGGLEFDVLRRLAQLYIESDAHPEGFHLLRQALKYHPQDPDAPAVRKVLQREFLALFSEEGKDRLPPLRALALFDEYRDLIPKGKAADRLIEHLAERLVTVDLLKQASDLLRHQVRFRLNGLEVARVGAREAVIRLLDRDPEGALNALDFSEVERMPGPLAAARDRVRARALLQLRRPNEAIILLLDDTSEEG
ncbi:MAG: tetratricopeptide repeat protein, partial [Alphaproteobacteria bacterium]|nr:tetratricopeptide repeat protein [Alphaproteobacteria bacterium]